MAVLQVGSFLGKYRIDALLGAGGLGEVYRAYDPTLRRHLAIKVLSSASAVAVSGDLLVEEARSASALSHPNICVVYEVGHQDGLAFIAMELIEGQSLKSVIGPGGIGVNLALRFGEQVAEALAHAHSRGVIHRDLKAANIIVQAEGGLKIVDFGLAKRLPRADDDTLSHGTTLGVCGLAGTAYTMAPEQIRGQEVDARTDVWAFGVLMAEMLLGSPPFSGSGLPDLFSAILRDDPELFRKDIPPWLSLLVLKCLEKRAEGRFEDGKQLLDALRRGWSGAPESPADAQGPPPRKPFLPALLRPAGGGAFSGRDREIGMLASCWEAACRGARQVVLLGGDPGVGKTRLCQEFAAGCIEAGALVLWGRCAEEALVTYQPFVESLGWFVRACGEETLRRLLAGVGGSADLEAFLPPLRGRLGHLDGPERTAAEAQRYRTFQAVSDFLASAASQQPVLMVLEDLHWADRPALLLLKHLARDPVPSPLCIVGTYRESDLGRAHPMVDLIADLRREERVARLSLGGLDAESVEKLVEEAMGGRAPNSFVRLLTEVTEGNPFFIGEILRHLKEKGALGRASSLSRPSIALDLPDGIREVVSRRLSNLGEPCNRVLALASAVGREFPLDLLARVAGLPEEEVLDLLDAAVEAHILSENASSPGRFTFVHDLIRDALYGGMMPSRRIRLHKRVAEALEEEDGSGGPPLSDLAYHYVQAGRAGDPEKAIGYSIRAAERNEATLAHEEAARFYGMALEMVDLLEDEERRTALAARLHGLRGRAFQEVGLWAQAEPELKAALSLAPAGQDLTRCELLLDLITGSFWLFSLDPVEGYAKEAVALARQLGRKDLEAEAMAFIGTLGQAKDGNLRKAMRTHSAALKISRGAPPYPKGTALAQIPLTLYLAGDLGSAVAVGFEIAQRARQVHDTSFYMHALSAYGISLAGQGRYAEAETIFEEARAFGKRNGVWPLLSRLLSMAAGFRMDLEDFRTAESSQQEAREMALGASFPPAVISTGIDLVLNYVRRGDPGKAEPLLPAAAEAVRQGVGSHAWLWRIRFHQATAELALARGDYDGAVETATQVLRFASRSPRKKYQALAYLARASAHEGAGRTGKGIVDLRRGLEVARRMGDPALTVRLIAPLLAREGDEALASEASGLVRRIVEALPDPGSRSRFLESSSARLIRRLCSF